jgi:hypothetical protein
VIFLGALSIFLSSLTRKPGGGLKVRQVEAFLGGLFGFLYVAGHFYWYRYAGLIPSRWVAIAFYVIWHVLGGMFGAMLLAVLFPKSAKALLGVGLLAFLALNTLAFLWYHAGRSTYLMLSSDGTGFFIGVLLFWVIRSFESDGTRNV